MDLKEKFGLNVSGNDIKASLRKNCLKVRLQEAVCIYVPFGGVESFIKMALSSSVDIVILSSENPDLSLD